jgi:ribosomal protein L23
MEIILKPIISEKMTEAGTKLVRYGFFVEKKAN